MMGKHDALKHSFYYFRLEDQVPETHLLRLIDKARQLRLRAAATEDSYSETGRPSINTELLLRILLIGYLHGIINMPAQTP